jgi:4-hydroxy-tetrahydrodipicolinate synthase
MTTNPELVQSKQTSRRGSLVAASLTPFAEDGSIDLVRFRAHLTTLLDDGCDRFVIFGSTGEGASIAAATKLEALQALVSDGVDPARLIVGVMETDAHEARRTVRWAAEAGAHAVLLLPPYYYLADDTGVFDFLSYACSDRDPGVDVLLYHIPQLSRFAFTPALIRRLGEHLGPRLSGIKDSTGNRTHTVDLARMFPDLAVFTGTDTDLPSVLAAGGAGIIGGLPNINARCLRVVIDRSGPENDAAFSVASKMLRLVEDRGGIAALKAIAANRYRDDGWLLAKAPLLQLSDCARAALLAEADVVGYGIDGTTV